MSDGTLAADGVKSTEVQKAWGVRGRLLLAFLAVSMFSLVAAITGINSISQVGRSLDQITEKRVPEALAWQELSRKIERMVLAAPALLAAETEEERRGISDDVFSQMETLSTLMSDARRNLDLAGEKYLLEGAIDVNSAADRAAELLKRIDENFVGIDKFVTERLQLNARRDEVLGRLNRGYANAQRTLSPSARILGSRLIDWQNGTGLAVGTVLSIEQAELARSIIASLPEQRTTSLFDAHRRQVETISQATSSEQVELLIFPMRRTLADLRTAVGDMQSRTRRRLETQIDVLDRLSNGDDGLPEIRKAELEAVAQAEQLLGLNTRLSAFLNNRAKTLVDASNERIENANKAAFRTRALNRNILLGVVVLSIISSLLIVWLYVSRNLIARLSALSNSMLAIAGGDLHAALPPVKGQDEITLMVHALIGFRDTAIEVEESNLSEVATARQRLIDAIESINEGFAFYDVDDRLVLSNERYKELLYDQADVDLTPGKTFEAILRSAIKTGLIRDAEDDPEKWLQNRMERHRNPGQPQLQQRAGNRWIMVSERKVAGGGTVALYSDLTTIKEYENELRASQERFSQLFENAPVAVFEEDWSGIKRELDRLKEEGVTDLERYSDEHPEFVANFANLVEWKDFNPAAITLYGAKDIGSLREHLCATEGSYSWDVYAQAALCFDRGEDHAPCEVIEQTVNGEDIIIVFTCQLGLDKSDWSSIATTSQDITKLKQREHELSHANNQIMASVHYASRIQQAMLPSRKSLFALLPDHFLIWEPRDIVGGDFFWCHSTDTGTYIVVGDCTGHGVPGAFMTLIACGLIDRRLRTSDQMTPGQLLTAIHADLQHLLGQNQENTETDDGLEAGVCFIDSAGQKMTFAGSRFSLFVSSDDGIEEIRGDKAGLGYNRYAANTAFTDTAILVKPKSQYILATDGLFDQIGGPKSRGFGKRRLLDFISQHRKTDIRKQGGNLQEMFALYQGDEHRRDDLTVLGFQIPET